MSEHGTDDLPGGVLDTGDDPMERRVILPRWLKVMCAAALVLAASSMFLSALLYAKQVRSDERQVALNMQRRGDNCRVFEMQEQEKIAGIIETYRFLDETPEALGPQLLRIVVQQLPREYEEAVAADAPSYCDAKGFGLPEPGPKLPGERDFSFLLDR